MATRTVPPPAPSATSGYSFVSYPAEYVCSPGGYPAHPHTMASMPSMPPMPIMEMPSIANSSPPAYPGHYTTNFAYAHMGPIGQGPPSPMMSHAHVSSGPLIHNAPLHAPPSPDRCSTDSKVMRHVLTAMTKMQSTMKELAERQEQILDRMSLLEQRVGRIDDGVERVLENTEILIEDSKSIRAHIDDNESQDAFELRLMSLMDGVANKLIGGIGDEVRDLSYMVKNMKLDPIAYQRYQDAEILGEEEQKEVDDV